MTALSHTPPVLCMHCMHCRDKEQSGGKKWVPFCVSPLAGVDLYDGSPLRPTCREARTPGGFCGPNGQGHAPIEVQP